MNREYYEKVKAYADRLRIDYGFNFTADELIIAAIALALGETKYEENQRE